MKCIPTEFILFLFLIQICPTYSLLKFNYPTSVSLSTGSILVIEKNGIYICDSSLTSITKTVYNFKEEEKITNENNLSNK